jgi:hypothetical protein
MRFNSQTKLMIKHYHISMYGVIYTNYTIIYMNCSNYLMNQLISKENEIMSYPYFLNP